MSKSPTPSPAAKKASSPVPEPLVVVRGSPAGLAGGQEEKRKNKEQIEALALNLTQYSEFQLLEQDLRAALASLRHAQTALMGLQQRRIEADVQWSTMQQQMAEVFVSPERAIRRFEAYAEAHSIGEARRTLTHSPQTFGTLRTTTTSRLGGLLVRQGEEPARSAAAKLAPALSRAWAAKATLDRDAESNAQTAYRAARDHVSQIRSKMPDRATTDRLRREIMTDLLHQDSDALNQLSQRTGWSREDLEALREPGRALTASADRSLDL